MFRTIHSNQYFRYHFQSLDKLTLLNMVQFIRSILVREVSSTLIVWSLLHYHALRNSSSHTSKVGIFLCIPSVIQHVSIPTSLQWSIPKQIIFVHYNQQSFLHH